MTTPLIMEIAGEVVVESNAWVTLYETGLPARYYVQTKDINPDYLVPSTRQTVCTYKGEAVYKSIRSGDVLLENVVWSYLEPWLDFSRDVGDIKGLYGLYSSAFDRVLVNGEVLESDLETNEQDLVMQSSPTIDSTLIVKMNK